MRTLRLVCLALASFCLPQSVNAQGGDFTTPAPHVVLMDAQTGIVLYEKDARKPMAPASMTKIMTASLVFDRLREGSINEDTLFTVSEEAWRRGGAASGSSTMFLDVKSKVSVKDLIKGVIIQSGNDACIVLAEGIAGSETAFADMMTARARELGLESATFRNSTGWPHPDHEISAYDLAQLAKYTINEYPDFYSLYNEPSFTWNDIKQNNRNPLLGRFTGADGLKTGHTEASKYGLVGSAKRGDQRIILVVNGLESNSMRSSESIRLMAAAFDSFKIYTLFETGASIQSAPVFMGSSDSVELITPEQIQVGFHSSLRNDMVVRVEFDGPIAAPITAGAQLGQLIVSVPGREDQSFPLLAKQDVERKGLVGRILQSLKDTIGG